MMPAIVCNQGQPNPLISAGDKKALALGYTRRVYISGGSEDGSFLVKPDTDLDDRFKAWAIDWDEWTWVTGSNCIIEDEDA